MKTPRMASMVAALMAALAFGEQAEFERARKLYFERCAGCHAVPTAICKPRWA
jgi:mono/diheme cytochrome c family protein